MDLWRRPKRFFFRPGAAPARLCSGRSHTAMSGAGSPPAAG